METAPNLVLVGPMGAGKSAIGRRLAERLGLPFADLDEDARVAEEMGATVSQGVLARDCDLYGEVRIQQSGIAVELPGIHHRKQYDASETRPSVQSPLAAHAGTAARNAAVSARERPRSASRRTAKRFRGASARCNAAWSTAPA